ncbi:outer membrane lipoprotein carrier protein LolA [Treponema sp. R6D11]
MRRITAVLALFFCAAGLWAQTPQEEIFKHPLDPQTTAAFETTCSHLAEHIFVRGNFEQEKTISRLKKTLKSSGNFIIAGGLGMVWDTVKPFPSTLTLGKDYIIQSRHGGQKTVLNAHGNKTFLQMAEVISAVFSGNSQGLIDNFKIYYSGDGGIVDAYSAWELGLIPLNKAIDAFAEKIIMKGDIAIRSILIYEQNGDTVLYILSNHSYPAELDVNEKAFFVLP